MGERSRRGFRPGVEGCEGWALTAGGAFAAAGMAPAETAGVFAHAHGVAAHAPTVHVQATGEGSRVRAAWIPGDALPVGPGLGEGLVRLALPFTYVKYGVITIWNNTPDRVSFGVSASTFLNGQVFAFTLTSGQVRSFYAPFVITQEPVFRVALNPRFLPTVVPKINVVFAPQTYLPAGTAGRPYAINNGVNGLYLSYI